MDANKSPIKMLLSIHFLTSEGREPIQLEIENSALVEDLKSMLSVSLDINPAQLRIILFHENSELLLSDPETLRSYGISSDSRILLDIISAEREAELAMRDQVKSRRELANQQEQAPLKDWLGLLLEKVHQGSLSGVLKVLGDFEGEVGGEDEESILHFHDDNGWTALHFACFYNHANIVQTLVSKFSDCNKETKDNWTPLIITSFYGYLECTKALLKHPGIQIDRMTQSRGTALHAAVRRGHLSIVQFLLEEGACMTIADQTGNIPLELASTQEMLEIIPKYMGNMELQRATSCSPAEVSIRFSGEVFYTGSLILHDRELFMSLDASQGVLDIFSSSDDFTRQTEPLMYLKLIDITQARTVNGPKFGPAEAEGFVLYTASGIYNFYTLEGALSIAWVKQIQAAIKYAQKNKLGMTFMPAEIPDKNQDPLEEIPGAAIDDSRAETVNFKSFSILELLGSGSFGKVYKVVQNDTRKVYALKALSKQFLTEHRQLKYAIGECKILRYLQHPFIIKLDFAFQTPKNLYMVLEYCPNGDLMSHLSERSRFPETVAKYYIAETILAIEYLHSLDIVYRDLKPENILLDRAGHIRLADFGLAKENVNPLNPAMSFCGSPAYLAPELLGKSGSEKAADVYGIGAILYELLTGMPPFYSDNIKELFRNIRKGISSFPKVIRPDAQDLLRKLMDKEPQKRLTISRLKSHIFFSGIDWEMLEAKKIKPPRLGARWMQMDEYPEHEYAQIPSDSKKLVVDEDYAEDNLDDAIAEFSFAR